MNKKSIFGLVFIALIAFCWWDYESHGVKQTSKVTNVGSTALQLSLIHISEPTRHTGGSRMPSSA